jgi:hypothetical protein
MKRRFVIGVEGLDQDDNKELARLLGRGNRSWWHWIENFWLFVTDESDPITASEIRDFIKGLNRKARVLVFEFERHLAWSGKGPKTPDKDMYVWLRKDWSPEDNERGSELNE